jgi:hypothetical protein
MLRSMTSGFDALGFVAQHGVVLASARGPVPSLAEAVAGAPIRGSWWAHPAGAAIFRALSAVADSPDVLSFRLVRGKITFVYRRLWPALVRLADVIGVEALTAIRQEHGERGAHHNVTTPFPEWVPREVTIASRRLSEPDARTQLGAWLSPRARRRRSP